MSNNKSPKSFGIWGNTDKGKFWELLEPILNWANEKKIVPHITTRIQDNLPHKFKNNLNIINSADDFLKLDFILSLGGDGTMLSAARAIVDRGIPIMGIHLGELGFLAEVTIDQMFNRLNLVSEGQYLTQSRMLLQASIDNKEISKTFYALIDFVIDRGKSQRILKMNLFSNGQFVSEYKADGLVFATPTGSTAYSLSACGPIVMPKLRASFVSPLSPHTLTLRPIVVPDDQLLEIKFPDHEKVAFAVDGQVNEYLDPDTKIIIQKSPYDIRMISFKDSNYFQTLMLKMGWGKRGKN